MTSERMTIDEFIESVFENLADRKGIDEVKQAAREATERYDKTYVLFSVLTDIDDRDVDSVSITSDSYPNAEEVNIDVFIDK